MNPEDLNNYLESFQSEVESWAQRFEEDRNHRWFVNYILMSMKIKEIVRNTILPIQEILKEIEEKYSELYEPKDIKYHLTKANGYSNHIRDLLRKIMQEYQESKEYHQIRLSWTTALPAVLKDTRDLRGRLLIIKRILNPS
jgi:hypothetical protein